MIKVTVGNNVNRTNVIIDEETTLRKCLEDNDIDYTRGVMHLDGSSLNPGDLDKTFKQFGITEKCFLLNVVKADNAARVTVLGEAVVITSALPLEAYRTIAKYRPKALTLMGEENGKPVPVFAVGITTGSGSINAVGASFGRESNDDAKLATVTMTFDGRACGDIKEHIADSLGAAIINLSKLEEQLPAVLSEIEAEKSAVMSQITVAQ